MKMNDTPFVIAEATPDDIGVIREIAWKTFPATYRSIISDEQIAYMMEWMYSEASLLRQMTIDHHTYLIAYLDGRAVGYVSVEPQGRHLWHLQKLYVLPEYQGSHCGSFLFRHATDYIRTHGELPCKMELNVNRNNKALDFYYRMGMRKDRQGDFDIGNGFFMNDYIMVLDI